MVLKISSSCTRKVTKLSLSVKTGDFLSDTTDVDPHGAVIRPPGFRGEWFKGFGYD